jgi:hypothetical protein
MLSASYGLRALDLEGNVWKWPNCIQAQNITEKISHTVKALGIECVSGFSIFTVAS